MDQSQNEQDVRLIINAQIQESMKESLEKSFRQLKEGKCISADEYMKEVGERYGITFKF